MHILLVDDDSVFLCLMERLLSRLGHSVAPVGTTGEALTYLGQEVPDLILIDLGLPGVVGGAFVEALGLAAPDVPFAIITGQQNLGRAVEMMRRGALDYLVKDVSLHERLSATLARIEENLARARRLRASKAAQELSEARRRALTEAAHDGVIEFDHEGIITAANPAAHHLLGVPPGTLPGQTGHRYFSKPGQALPSHADTITSNLVLDTNGHPLAAEASFIAAHVDDRVYHAVFIRDISQRLLLEQEILNVSEAERLNFGQELHDGLGQQVAGLTVLSGLLAGNLQKRGSELAPQAEKVAHGISEALSQLRSLAQGLASLGVSDQGLVRALTQLSIQIEETYHIECRFTHDEGVDITAPDIALHLYRIAQEASSNASRHGHARKITFSLTREGSACLLRISDDGNGFSKTALAGADGLGLRTMRHRAEVIGARFSVRSSPSQGTSILCHLPDHRPRPPVSPTL